MKILITGTNGDIAISINKILKKFEIKQYIVQILILTKKLINILKKC